MSVFTLLLLPCLLLLSLSAVVSGQGFRCPPDSTSSLCNVVQPNPAGLLSIQADPADPPDAPGAPRKSLPRIQPFSIPTQPILCSALYRTFDGSCTNLKNSEYGAAGTAQLTIVPGSSSLEPNGENRPSARHVSNVISEQGDVDIPNRRGLTLFFVFFGQLLDHDLVLTPTNPSEPFNIPVPKGDSIFANVTSPIRCRGRSCGSQPRRSSSSYGGGSTDSDAELAFSRSLRAVTSPFNPNQQRPVNAISSPIDLSEVYGSEEERFEKLHVSGSCKMLTSHGGRFLPLNDAGIENEPSFSNKFFLAGDVRSNENPALTSLHTIFIREHNRLCDELEKSFPGERQSTLFELARKVNIFQMQKIVYEEFLPVIMGKKIKIGPYNSRVNPSVSDIFSTAAFRLGHTMVGNTLPTGIRSRPELEAKDMFFRDANTYKSIGSPGFFLNGAARTRAQEIDVKVVDTLRNFLFSNVDELAGIDLIALNLQRGRDHALPSYNTVRNFFGLPTIKKFQDVTGDVALQFKLRRTYKKVDDMDLWVALLAENHVRGASMGETMLKVWEWEFRRLAEGDRFFYKVPNLFNKSFKKTFSRYEEIVKTKTLMRDILVRNTGRIRYPKSVFRMKVSSFIRAKGS